MHIAFLVGVYFLPTIIACARKHHNAMAVALVNLLLGWTVIGWIVALVWSSTASTARPAGPYQQPAPHDGRPGDDARNAREAALRDQMIRR